MKFSKSSTILVPPGMVYDWHARDGAFERLLPPWESVELMESVGPFEDRFVQLKMKRFGIPIKWLAKHEDVVKGASFTDIQVKGPFKSWRHQHEFVKLSDTRTKLVDTIECRLALSYGGQAGGRVVA